MYLDTLQIGTDIYRCWQISLRESVEQSVLKTKQLQDWIWHSGLLGAYHTEGFHWASSWECWQNSKCWATKDQEGMSQYTRDCEFLSPIHSKLCSNNCTYHWDLTRSRAAKIVKWGDSQEWAFNEIRHLLSSEPILKLPDLDKEFILQTDASNRSLGGCLLQEHDGVRHPVLYASRKLLPREPNYSVGEREAFAIIWAVDKFGYRSLFRQTMFRQE